jgi:hypothetical protein
LPEEFRNDKKEGILGVVGWGQTSSEMKKKKKYWEWWGGVSLILNLVYMYILN